MTIEEWEILSKLPDEEVERLSRIKAAGGTVNEVEYNIELYRHQRRLARRAEACKALLVEENDGTQGIMISYSDGE